MPKLLTVTAEFEYVIVVEDNANIVDQYAIAANYAQDAFRDLSTGDMDFHLSSYPETKPYLWDDECIPYGGDGNTRSGEYLK